MINRKIVELLRAKYPEGTKVELIYMDDKQAPPVGTSGVVSHVDDAGTVHIRWDNGSGLGAVYGADKVKKIS